MATEKTFVTYLLEGLTDVRVRPMMGECLLYYKERLAGLVCDNCLFVKPTDGAKALLGGAPYRAPYEGAKEMLAVEEVDDKRFLTELFEAIYPQLPERKKK